MDLIRYQLEHTAFPTMLYRDTEAFTKFLLSSSNLEAWLKDVYSKYYKGSLPEDLDINGCKAKVQVLSDTLKLVFFKLPKPVESLQCYRIYILIKLEEDGEKVNDVFYYTVEEEINSLTGEHRPYLCGWTKDFVHMNYGSHFKNEDPINTILLEQTFFTRKFLGLEDKAGLVKLYKEDEIDDIDEDNVDVKQVTCLACSEKFIANCNNIGESTWIITICPVCGQLIVQKIEKEQ